MRVAIRGLASLAAFVGAFIVAAIVLTIADLYISGHGGRALGARPVVSSATLGMYLSQADCFAIGLATAAAVGMWLMTARATPRRR